MATASRSRAVALAAGCATAAAVLAQHRPSAVASTPGDPTSLVVGAATWSAWALAIYLLLAMALGAVVHLRRTPGRSVRALPAPAALRRLVEVAVGATAAAATVALTPAAAFADTGHGPVATASAEHGAGAPLDWPGLRPPAGSDRPGRQHTATAIVRPGDSLWSVTARRLGPVATPAKVAAAWPRVYAANRAVIGPDPALIHPGQRLTLPPTTGGAP